MAESDTPASQSVSVAAASPSPLRIWGPPMGLWNLNTNTCYLNSVLQCLTFTPPLAKYCRRQLHSTSCTRRLVEDCSFCILERRICCSLTAKVGADTPRELYKQLMNSNSQHFQPLRQEDAHELLRFLLEDCGKVLQPGAPDDQPQRVLDDIFGGRLQSQIKCELCDVVSTKREEILDLSLEISRSCSLEGALTSFFLPEVLHGENQYRCGKCDGLSDARKQLSIFRPPKVLTILLKRFDNVSGTKLDHHIPFEGRLSVGDYMRMETEILNPQYTLYGVIVHSGPSLTSGHYYSYVKETDGKWYLCDDETVIQVIEEQVLTAKAYMLFYIRSYILSESELENVVADLVA